MLYEEKDLPELHYMKHRHDNDKNYVDYEKGLFSRSISPYVYRNALMSGFLDKIEPLVAKFFDQMNIIKNFQNYMVDKYHYKQK